MQYSYCGRRCYCQGLLRHRKDGVTWRVGIVGNSVGGVY
jgi:hypothetical protein